MISMAGLTNAVTNVLLWIQDVAFHRILIFCAYEPTVAFLIVPADCKWRTTTRALGCNRKLFMSEQLFRLYYAPCAVLI